MNKFPRPRARQMFIGIVSKLTIKFWMCQKCDKMKSHNKNDYECCRMITYTLDMFFFYLLFNEYQQISYISHEQCLQIQIYSIHVLQYIISITFKKFMYSDEKSILTIDVFQWL
jgi:hypothetical protein